MNRTVSVAYIHPHAHVVFGSRWFSERTSLGYPWRRHLARPNIRNLGTEETLGEVRRSWHPERHQIGRAMPGDGRRPQIDQGISVGAVTASRRPEEIHAMTIGCSSGGQATILRRPSTSSATFIVSIHRCLPLTSWISPVAWSNLRETTCISTGEPREAGDRRQRLFQANLQACMHDSDVSRSHYGPARHRRHRLRGRGVDCTGSGPNSRGNHPFSALSRILARRPLMTRVACSYIRTNCEGSRALVTSDPLCLGTLEGRGVMKTGPPPRPRTFVTESAHIEAQGP